MANEKRLIDANQLIKRLEKMKHDTDAITIDGIIRALKEPSTVDAVEVVRCKDCEYYSYEHCNNIMPGYGFEREPDDFCSYGERRE